MRGFLHVVDIFALSDTKNQVYSAVTYWHLFLNFFSGKNSVVCVCHFTFISQWNASFVLADCFLIIGKPNQGGYSVFCLLHHFLLHLFWFLPHKRSRVSLFHVVYHIKSSFLEYLFYNKRERNWATNVYGFSVKYLHFLSSENTIFKTKKVRF